MYNALIGWYRNNLLFEESVGKFETKEEAENFLKGFGDWDETRVEKEDDEDEE